MAGTTSPKVVTDGYEFLDEKPASETEVHEPRVARQASRGITVPLGILTGLAILITLYFTRAVAFPIVLSMLLALPLRPVVRWFTQWGLPSVASATIVVAIILSLGGAAFWFVASPARQWMESVPAHLVTVEYKLRALREPMADMQKAGATVEQITQGVEDPATVKVEVKQPSLTSAVLNTTTSLLTGGVITFSLLFLLLAFGDDLLEGTVAQLQTRYDRRNLRSICLQAESTISHYLLVCTCINIGLGVVIGLGLWLIGVPNPILWGVMAACLNYLPFIGLAVGTGVIFLVGLISFDSVPYALLAPAIYLLANGLEANLVTPALLGRSLRLNVILIFLFIVIWGWMWGIGGALIAVPLLGVLKVTCDHTPRLKPLGELIAA
jgi:predicted PurR-regulated permease PerM